MNAYTRTLEKDSQQLYRKVGKKYVLVNDPWSCDGLRDGWWLIRVGPCGRTTRQIVYPAKAELLAAARDKEDQLVDIIREASEARYNAKIQLSDQAAKDWKHFMAKHGDEFSTLYYPSIAENAEKIVKALLNK